MSKDRDLKPGKLIGRGGKVFTVCSECLRLVRVDKPIFGSLHLCVPR